MSTDDQGTFETAMHELEQAAMECGALSAELARHYQEDEAKNQKNRDRYNMAREALVRLAGFTGRVGRAV